jgi:hypothetical protein
MTVVHPRNCQPRGPPAEPGVHLNVNYLMRLYDLLFIQGTSYTENVLGCHMSIDHGGLKILVTEQLLNCPDIRLFPPEHEELLNYKDSL